MSKGCGQDNSELRGYTVRNPSDARQPPSPVFNNVVGIKGLHCHSMHISTIGTTKASALFSCCCVWLTRLQLLRHMTSKSFQKGTRCLAMHPRMPNSQAYKVWHPYAKLIFQAIRRSDDTIQTRCFCFIHLPSFSVGGLQAFRQGTMNQRLKISILYPWRSLSAKVDNLPAGNSVSADVLLSVLQSGNRLFGH